MNERCTHLRFRPIAYEREAHTWAARAGRFFHMPLHQPAKKFKKRRPSKREWTSEHGWAGTYGGNAVSGECLRHHVTHSSAPGLRCSLEDALQTRRSVLARSSSAGLLAVAVPTCLTLRQGEETRAGSEQGVTRGPAKLLPSGAEAKIVD